MPLESLHALVETLRRRIQTHRVALSGSEWLTRYTLIDPLLRELGWNTEDPELVIPEYRSGSGSADYALLSNDGKPAMMIEAKKLGTSLSLDVVTQVLNYCWAEGTEHFAVTDGQQWQIYETNAAGSPDDKRVASFNLLDASPSDVCLKALALWRQNIASGKVGTAHTPVVTPTDDALAVVQHPEPPVAALPTQAKLPAAVQQPEPPIATPPTQPTPTPAPSVSVVDTNEEWLQLTEVREVRQRGIKSIEIYFPDDSRLTKNYWYEVVEEIVLWLIDKGYLRANHCPIKPQKGSRYIIHTQPYHSDGEPFRQSKPIGSLFLHSAYGMGQQIRNLRTIIQHVGQDPSQFKVRW